MIINSSNKLKLNQDIIFNQVKKLIKINEKKRNFSINDFLPNKQKSYFYMTNILNYL